jgi:RimJ/RimL family protein N-acetyltransferase
VEDRFRLAKHWRLFALSVTTPRLELRYPTDADLADLAELAGDVHDPEFMPFQIPWTALPEGERERGLLQYHWRNRAGWSVDDWRIELVTVVAGEIAGVQGLFATGFPVRRTTETGSWLARARQGQGIGKEMRVAMLHLAFVGLGAARSETGAFDDNAPSLGVTRHLGYVPNGELWHDRLGSRARELRFAMDREGFAAIRRDDVEITGLTPCLPLFGLGDDDPAR